MTPESFEIRWGKFKLAVCDGLEPSPEQLNAMRICFIAGMVEMFTYLTHELSTLEEPDALERLDKTNRMLRTVSAEEARIGFKIWEGAHGQG